jgi:hypothetical protein
MFPYMPGGAPGMPPANPPPGGMPVCPPVFPGCELLFSQTRMIAYSAFAADVPTRHAAAAHSHRFIMIPFRSGPVRMRTLA